MNPKLKSPHRASPLARSVGEEEEKEEEEELRTEEGRRRSEGENKEEDEVRKNAEEIKVKKGLEKRWKRGKRRRREAVAEPEDERNKTN